jgi:hypothetical protein
LLGVIGCIEHIRDDLSTHVDAHPGFRKSPIKLYQKEVNGAFVYYQLTDFFTSSWAVKAGIKKPSTPAPAPTPAPTPSAKLDASALAAAIKAGKYGVEPNRTKKLTAEGYTAAEIKAAQAIVNGKAPAPAKPVTPAKPAPAPAKPAPAKKSTKAIAEDIWKGRKTAPGGVGWGNNPGRKQKLVAAGYTAAEIKEIQKYISKM